VAIPPDELASYVREKKLYWKGTYSDLQEQTLKIRGIHRPACVDAGSCCGLCGSCGLHTWRGCYRVDFWEKEIPLKKIANGSVQQEFEISQDVKGVGNVDTGTLQFKILYEEVFDFELELVNWKVSDVHAVDGATSDPYLKLSIAGDYWKPFTVGGLFNRSTRSETEYNTLFAKWSELPSIYYNGTWSEFQNEILLVQCFDEQLLGIHECIGWTNVPFSGQIRDDGSSAEGQIAAALAYSATEQVEVWVPDGAPKKTESKAVVKEQGSAAGTVQIAKLPKYRQFGAPCELKSGITYLGIEICKATSLPATDENGLTDAFFVVTWSDMEQKTKVVQKTLNPVFRERLYFPILLFEFSAEEFQKKQPYVSISAFDWDPDGSSDFLGYCEFMIHEISSASVSTQGTPPLTARFADKTLKLKKCIGKEAAVSIKAWFEPHPMKDVDGYEITLDAPKSKEATALPEMFETRAKEWLEGIKALAPRAYRKCHALTEAQGPAFRYMGTDERSVQHFLPKYLGPLQGPLDLQNPYEVFRMVVSVPYEEEPDTGGGAEDCWASPKFFLDVKKGQSEDHAIFLANMFLGLGYRPPQPQPHCSALLTPTPTPL